MNHWLLRIGDGQHFNSSKLFNIWGVNSNLNVVKGFLNRVKYNDVLWFIPGKCNGQIFAMANFKHYSLRNIENNTNLSNEDLGWIKQQGEWDTEIHFFNLIEIKEKIYTEIKGTSTIRLLNQEKCKINLPELYQTIINQKQPETPPYIITPEIPKPIIPPNLPINPPEILTPIINCNIFDEDPISILPSNNLVVSLKNELIINRLYSYKISNIEWFQILDTIKNDGQASLVFMNGIEYIVNNNFEVILNDNIIGNLIYLKEELLICN